MGLIFLLARIGVGGPRSSRLLTSIGVLSMAKLSLAAVGSTCISSLVCSAASSLCCRTSGGTSPDPGGLGSELLADVAASLAAFSLISCSLVIMASSARRAAVNYSSRRPASRSFRLRPSDVAARHCSILRRHSSELFLLWPVLRRRAMHPGHPAVYPCTRKSLGVSLMRRTAVRVSTSGGNVS